MELFSAEWFGALLSIILIDLVLAGDNAYVIAMAASSLPKQQQRTAVLLGSAGAIIIRIIFATVAIYLLRISFLKAIGGLLLFWIAYKLIKDSGGDHAAVAESDKQPRGLFDAMMLIVFADAVMGIDNALAIAGAARDDVSLVVIGLLLSIPIIMWGSFLIIKMIKKHPWITWAGSALLGWTGGSMIASDVWLEAKIFADVPGLGWLAAIVPALFFFGLGWWFSRRRRPA